MPRTALAAFLLFLAACGGADAPAAAAEVTLDTIGGVVHVRNAGEPAGWRLEPRLRLGSEDGGPQEFGAVRALLADASGNVYVAENMVQQVRVFAPDGRHLRTFGRRGRGPGEFEAISGIAWAGEGRLAVLDPRNARIGILSAEGEWLDSWRHFPITGAPADVRLFPEGADGFYAKGIPPGGARRLPLQRFTADGPGAFLPEVAPPDGAPPVGVACHTPDGGITFVALRDAPRLLTTPGRGGAQAVSWTAAYRIALLSAEGDTVRVVERDRRPVALPDSVWEADSAPYRELRRRFPGADCEPSSLQRPAHRAALRHLLFDEVGRMWVEAATPEGFAWEVFDAEGRLVASAPAPRRDADIPPYVRDGRLYQVERDALEVPYVGVYQLTSEGG